MSAEYKEFLILFNQLNSEIKGRAERLPWLAGEKQAVWSLARLVGKAAHQIKKNQATASTKSAIVPKGFVTAWKEYENHYAQEVDRIQQSDQAKNEDEQRWENLLTELNKLPEKDREDWLQEFLAKIRRPGDTFDPLRDDAAYLIGHIIGHYEDWSRYDPDCDKAIGAWDFFRTTIGVDHDAFFARWKRVPYLLIPAHLLQPHQRALTELYTEAVRCFVFGNVNAAVAMCRSLLEHVLKKHYGINEEGLEKIVTTAEARYPRFKKMKLHKMRMSANAILHNYEKGQGVKEESVVEFLNTIRALVLDVPGSSR